MKDSIHREPNTAGVCLRCDPLVPTCEVRKGTAPRSHKDYSWFMIHVGSLGCTHSWPVFLQKIIDL